jgi:hypothetical protein
MMQTAKPLQNIAADHAERDDWGSFGGGERGQAATRGFFTAFRMTRLRFRSDKAE